MERLTVVLLFVSWLLCGCSVDMMFDDPRAAGTAAVALIVMVACTVALNRRD